MALVDVLSTLVSNKTFPQFVQGLCDGGPRIAAGIGWALSSSRNYAPGLLLDALSTKGMSKSALMDAIHAQRDRFNVRELLTAAYAQEPNEKAALFRVVGEIADASAIPGIAQPRRGQGPDRAHAHHQYPVALQQAGGQGRAGRAAAATTTR